MSRPRTDTNVLKMRGSFKKNPQRLKERENEPKPVGGLGDPPEEFNEVHNKRLLQAWHEVVAMVPPGVLTCADRIIVEMTARLIARMRYNFNSMKSSDRAQLTKNLGLMGLTPADRSKVQVVPEKPADDGFSGFR